MVGPGDAFEKGDETEEDVLGQGVEREGFAKESRDKVGSVPAWGYGVLEVIDVGVTVGFCEVPDVAGEGGVADESEDPVCFGGICGVGGDRRVEFLNDGIQTGR